jgi:hypothetical protein
LKNKFINDKDSQINPIFEHLYAIRNRLFDCNNSLKEQIGCITQAELMKSLDYLEKEKDILPDPCKREMECVLKKVRQIISNRYRIL